ncbi:LysE/ArgO family amino acid transporter [Crenobacter sp. SG2305]|uniref:LysE/ArgO family amino acid transporter n=1 Tax=Crenobacter oryzisoli TaxID=3056844 RepID=UPI0025AB2E77|nr:LysE/ArgO family amino acid transporter [Crenobacter sp. SG2305]MDN0083734.1 LysE/ArgO family amino acid transporter [Crenobacter sp. SG2305]
MTYLPLLEGFGMGASLIMAIGAQNAFVLKNGLQGRHRLPIALCCALSDMLLIALGVAGVGALIAASPTLLQVVRWAGVAFLVCYAVAALRRAWRGESMSLDGRDERGLAVVLLTTLAVTWLNPHVYLDTVVLLGSLAARYPGEGRYLFGVGAVCASFLWFFALAYCARLLAPLFVKPAAWRVLDAGVAAILLALAWGLVSGA